jgi:hypothetical protein
VTGILFGLAPALQCTNLDLATALKETRTTQPRARHSLLPVSVMQLLVVGQIAISLALLIAAGLFVRTLSNLQSVNLGFNQETFFCSRSTLASRDIRTPISLSFTKVSGNGWLRSQE